MTRATTGGPPRTIGRGAPASDPKLDVVLCTLDFPFGVGEQFIEAELGAWTEENLEIAPAAAGSSRRPTPDVGVRVDVPRRFASRGGSDPGAAVRALLSSLPWLELVERGPSLLRPRRVLCLGIFLYRALRYERALAQALGKRRLSRGVALYCYWFSWQTLAAVLVKRRYPATVVFCRAHRADLYEYTNTDGGLYHPFRAWMARGCDRVYPISEDARLYLTKAFGVAPERMALSRLGARAARAGSVVSVPEGGRSDTIRVLSVSYAKPVKRIDAIMDMLERVAAERPDLRLAWTHLGDGPSLEGVRARVASSPLRIRLPGQVSNGEVLRHYESDRVDVFVNLSRSEGVPVSIMEAMAHGVPVIATDCGGVREIVDDEVGALLPVALDGPRFVQAFLHALRVDRRKVLERFERLCCAETNYARFVKDVRQLVCSRGHVPSVAP